MSLADPLLLDSIPHSGHCAADLVPFVSLVVIASLCLVSVTWASLLSSAQYTNGRDETNLLDWSGHQRPLYVPPEHITASKMPTDELGYKREFLYTPQGTPRAGSVVDCRGWDSSDESSRQQLVHEALAQLRASGYVVLERLIPSDLVQAASEDFRVWKHERGAGGMLFDRMRSRRDMTIPPLSGIWLDDRLTRHPMVFKLLSHYLRNSLDPINYDKANEVMDKWMTFGAPIDFFQEGGSFCNARPIMDLMVVIDTPPGAPAQQRHRDTFAPGPASSIGVHIPLTPLQAEPLNGAIGFTPGAHLYEETRKPNAKRDVIGAVPQGSVILYDSFIEHHGLENDSGNPRSALFTWYRVPGVYSGHSDENFQPPGWRETTRWRRHTEETLLPAVRESRGWPCPGKELVWGWPVDQPLVDWGEERVCFRCDRTTGDGSYHNVTWFCNHCWADSRARGVRHPEPSVQNAATPVYKLDEYTEEEQKKLDASGIIKAWKGKHKLALLRERGHFIPIDPTSEWLTTIARDPQPHHWKQGIKTSIGEAPRSLDDPKRNEPAYNPLEGMRSKKDLAASKAEEEGYSVLPEGAVVLIRGLNSRPELNEKVAFVKNFTRERKRYTVTLQDTDETMALLAEKLQHVVLNARIRGMDERPEMNGVEGIVYEFEQESGRFKVQVTSKQAVLRLLPEKIELPNGTSVEVMGVQKQPELNGRRGKIVSYDEVAGRYAVQMSQSEIKQLRATNVRP